MSSPAPTLAADVPAADGGAADGAAAAPPAWRSAVRAMRLHQWAKNALVLLPLALAHEIGDAGLAGRAGLAFLAMGLCASGTYVVNDLLDRERDREHPSKRRRPFASGALSPAFGWAFGPALVAAAFALALSLPAAFAGVLGLYLATTLSYSLRLKAVVGLDVLILAGLYALRLLAGGAATGVPVSEWLLAFSLFFFLGLAVLKRYAEMRLVADGVAPADNGRGYHVRDAPLLLAFGVAAGMLAVLVFVLYVQSPAVAALYAHAQWLWLAAPPLLYWTLRVWLLAHRGEMDADPVLFAVKDPASYAVAVSVGAVLAASA